jgi:hypothetical protein
MSKPLTIEDIRKAVELLKEHETPQSFVAAPWIVEEAQKLGMTTQEYADYMFENINDCPSKDTL